MGNVTLFPQPDSEPLPPAVESAERKQFEPGVYFGLDEDSYHADLSLGSTDMKRLAYSPADYWFESPLNPMRQAEDEDEPKKKRSLIVGTAVHKCVLEGTAGFVQRYTPCEHPGNRKEGIEERKKILAEAKIPLARKDYDAVMLAGAMIRANPFLSEAFENGLSEVSVFWEANGLRKKARIDYLKQRASVDLKSIRNSRRISFPEACRRAIADFRYDIQCEHYREGREAARTLISEERIFGFEATGAKPEWLAKVATQSEFAWVFIFWQPEGAPLTWATQISPGNPVLSVARSTIEIAERNYREYFERFGTEIPWVLAEPIMEFDLSDLPSWSFR